MYGGFWLGFRASGLSVSISRHGILEGSWDLVSKVRSRL